MNQDEAAINQPSFECYLRWPSQDGVELIRLAGGVYGIDRSVYWTKFDLLNCTSCLHSTYDFDSLIPEVVILIPLCCGSQFLSGFFYISCHKTICLKTGFLHPKTLFSILIKWRVGRKAYQLAMPMFLVFKWMTWWYHHGRSWEKQLSYQFWISVIGLYWMSRLSCSSLQVKISKFLLGINNMYNWFLVNLRITVGI